MSKKMNLILKRKSRKRIPRRFGLRSLNLLIYNQLHCPARKIYLWAPNREMKKKIECYL